MCWLLCTNFSTCLHSLYLSLGLIVTSSILWFHTEDPCLPQCYPTWPICAQYWVGTRRAAWVRRSESELTDVCSFKYSLKVDDVCGLFAFDMLSSQAGILYQGCWTCCRCSTAFDPDDLNKSPALDVQRNKDVVKKDDKPRAKFISLCVPEVFGCLEGWVSARRFDFFLRISKLSTQLI